MKRLNFIIYLFLLTTVLHVSCEKQADTSNASPSAGSGAGGSLARFAIVGNYLYIVGYGTLTSFDITDPTKPVKKNTVNAGIAIETIFPYKDKLFLGSAVGMYIFSLANPALPVKEGEVTHIRACDPVVSNDTASYVTLRNFGTSCGASTSNVLNIYDIKNLKTPRLVRTELMKSPYGLGIKQKGLYVCEGVNGLTVFELTGGYNVIKKKEIKDETYYDVIPYGDVLIAFISKGICFYDISNPLEPVLLSKLKG
ncbi:MAG: hypothetical protein WCF67_21855 [Chitinophagaceae bacterium]